MFEFFSSGSVFCCFWVFNRDILLVWHFALPRVFCVCLCCLELLNTLCFTIIRLDVALLLLLHPNCLFLFSPPLSNLSGFWFSFHTNRKLSVQFRPFWVCRHLQFVSDCLTCRVFSSSPASFRPVTAGLSLRWIHRCGMKICSVFCSFFTWEPKNYRHSIQILKHSVLTWC